jgi:hypothetical protein
MAYKYRESYGGVNVKISVLLTSARVGGEWSALHPCRVNPGETTPGTHWIAGWLDPRALLNNTENLKFLTLSGLVRPLSRAARTKSLYRLYYRGSWDRVVTWLKKWGWENLGAQGSLERN